MEVRPDPNYPVQGDESWHWPIMPRAVRSVGTMELERPIVARLPLALIRERRNAWFGIERPKYTEPRTTVWELPGATLDLGVRLAGQARNSEPLPLAIEPFEGIYWPNNLKLATEWSGMLTVEGLSTGDNRG